jgi:hypothetical protein
LSQEPESSPNEVGVVHVLLVVGGDHEDALVALVIQMADQGFGEKSSVSLLLVTALNPFTVDDGHAVLDPVGDQDTFGGSVVHVTDNVLGSVLQVQTLNQCPQVLDNPGTAYLESFRPGNRHFHHAGKGLLSLNGLGQEYYS